MHPTCGVRFMCYASRIHNVQCRETCAHSRFHQPAAAGAVADASVRGYWSGAVYVYVPAGVSALLRLCTQTRTRTLAPTRSAFPHTRTRRVFCDTHISPAFPPQQSVSAHRRMIVKCVTTSAVVRSMNRAGGILIWRWQWEPWLCVLSIRLISF